MKDQASLNLLIVDSPIDSKALEGHLMLRATSDGLKLYDNAGAETPIGGEVDESRLLPTGGQNGYILGYNESADRGNSADVKLLLQNALTDSAYGNESPAAVTQSGVTLTSDNTLEFDGNGSYVNAVLPNEIFAADSEWTIDGWIKPTANSSEWNYILTDNAGDWGTRSIGLTWNSEDQVLEQDTGGYVASVIKSSNWPNDKIACAADTWHFIAVEKQKTSTGWALNYYLNGSLWLQVEFTGEFVPFDSTDPFRFGGRTSDSGREFKGEANRIRVTAGARYGGKAFSVPDRTTDYEAPTGLPAWVTGYVKSVNGQTPDDDGNVAIEVSGSVDLSDYNTTGAISMKADGSISLISNNGNDVKLGSGSNSISVNDASTTLIGETVAISGNSSLTLNANGNTVDIRGNTILFNSAMLNEANGLVQLNSSGKIPGELYDASVDLSNYSGSSVAITATGSSGDLIKFAASETGASITFTDDAYIHITGDVQTIIDVGNGVDISSSTSNTADTLRINGNALNTAGGLVQLGSDGKIPTSLYEAGNTEIDWSNITASIVSFGSSGSNIGPFSVYADSITLEGSNIAISSSSAPTLNGHAQNTANGFAIVGDDGKLPSSIIPESTGGTVDLTDYVGTGNISLTTGKENLLTLKADTMMEGYESTFKLGTGASAAGGNGAYLELNGGSFGVTGYGAYFGSTNSQMSIFQINAQTLMYNNAEQNQPNGLVVLGSDGKIPSGLYDVGSSTVDLSNYTTSDAISLSADSGITLQTLGTSFYMNGSGANITMTDPLLSLSLNNHLPNTAGGFVIVPDDGKLPSSILPESTGSSVDLSAYTGGINLNSTNDSAVAIKFNSGNSTYNAALTMDAAGVTLSGYGDVTLQHTGGSYLRLTSGEATLSSNSSLTLSASSRLTISAKEGIYLGGAGLNTAGGLVKVGDDGKIPSSLYDAGTGGDTSALETRVTTLETTVGTLNTTVDEILADYGEGSGALVYRVVASATEPENPTEGMLWIKTE